MTQIMLKEVSKSNRSTDHAAPSFLLVLIQCCKLLIYQPFGLELHTLESISDT